MNSTTDSNLPISIWLDDAKKGDDEAFERLWSQFFPKLVRMARRHIGGAPNRSTDEEDIVENALTSFCFRAREGYYPDLRDRESLWKLLMSITRNKALAIVRKEGRRRELLEDEYAGQTDVSNEPSPEFAAEMNDQLRYLLDQLPDDLLKQIAVLKLNGHTNNEICEQVGMSIASVGRKLNLIRQCWKREVQKTETQTDA